MFIFDDEYSSIIHFLRLSIVSWVVLDSYCNDRNQTKESCRSMTTTMPLDSTAVEAIWYNTSFYDRLTGLFSVGEESVSSAMDNLSRVKPFFGLFINHHLSNRNSINWKSRRLRDEIWYPGIPNNQLPLVLAYTWWEIPNALRSTPTQRTTTRRR